MPEIHLNSLLSDELASSGWNAQGFVRACVCPLFWVCRLSCDWGFVETIGEASARDYLNRFCQGSVNLGLGLESSRVGLFIGGVLEYSHAGASFSADCSHR
jgi:hypothetical protein